MSWTKWWNRLLGKSRMHVALRGILRPGQPGAWSSDHRAESQHFTGWNYVAIRAIALQAVRATVAVYDDSQGDVVAQHRRRKGHYDPHGATRPLAVSHPLCRLLKRPNPYQTGASFRYEQVVQLGLTGTCYIWKVPNAVGRTVERYVIPTAAVTAVGPSREMPGGGYRVSPSAGLIGSGDGGGVVELPSLSRIRGAVVPASQMMVVRWPHPWLKHDGYSSVVAGALFIDTAEQIDRARWAHLKNGADPSLVITAPEDIDPSQEELDAAAARFNEKYSGTANTGKAMFVTGGKVEKLSTSPKEMDYISAFSQLRDAVLALHGVPGVAAGISDGGSYASFYASLRQFTALTVQPTLDLLAEEETEQQACEFGDCLTVEMTAAHIDDPELNERQLETDLAAGAITRGELRALRGRAPFGDCRDGELACPAIGDSGNGQATAS